VEAVTPLWPHHPGCNTLSFGKIAWQVAAIAGGDAASLSLGVGPDEEIRDESGLLLCALAGQGNTLIEFWNRCFGLPGEAVPCHTAEHLQTSRSCETRCVIEESDLLWFADTDSAMDPAC
jgi:hypothetical protein